MLEFQKAVQELKDKVINNVDLHFNNYIIEELKDVDDDDYFLIDSVNWSIYWTDRLSELKPVMDQLLQNISLFADKEPYDKLLYECVELKRIIDSNILKYEIAIKKEDAIDAYEIMRYAGIYKRAPKFPEPIIFSETDGKIKALCEGLKNIWGYIDLSYEEFKAHTSKSNNGFEKIKWKTNDSDLALLIIVLVRYNFLPKIYTRRINQVRLIMTHFINKEGNSFESASTRSLLLRMEKEIDYPHHLDFIHFIANL